MKFLVAANDCKNLEAYLLQVLKLGPRKELKIAFLDKKILLNGKPARRTSLIQTQDQIEIKTSRLQTKNDFQIIPNPEINFVIIHEEKDFIVVNKPAGLHSHPQSTQETDTVLNALVAQYPNAAKNFRKDRPLEGGLVHRLDQGTSGLLVCAFTQEKFDELSKLWKTKKEPSKVTKIYWAKVERMENLNSKKIPAGKITLYLAHDSKNSSKMNVYFTKPDKIKSWEAVSLIYPLKAKNEVLIQIETGVTHQIRATLSALGFPVKNDSLYAKASHLKTKSIAPNIEPLSALEQKKLANVAQSIDRSPTETNGFFLHAIYLSFSSLELQAPFL